MKLVRYDAMCRAIEEAHKVDEVKDIRDRASALEHYAHQAQNTDAERRAAQIRMRAERKAGQLLAEMPKANGRPEKASTATRLSDLGITYDQSSQWQKLGAMSQKDFDCAIGTSVKPPSTKGVLRAAAPQPLRIADPEAIWLWGRLRDFERDGLLEKNPSDLIRTMTGPMKDEVHRLAPKVAKWLKQIGAMQ
jgi:hypothetical protein